MMKSFCLFSLLVGLVLGHSVRASEPIQFDDVVTSEDVGAAVPGEALDFAVAGGYTDASCVDGHGTLHKAHCASPYVARCSRPTPGQCLCGCYYKPHR